MPRNPKARVSLSTDEIVLICELTSRAYSRETNLRRKRLLMRLWNKIGALRVVKVH